MRKYLIATLLVVILVGGALVVERSLRLNRGSARKGTLQGQVLPAGIKVRSLANQEVPLSNFSGKVVLINFWASWCEACMSEMPSLERLYRMLGPEGLIVLGINVDEKPQGIVPPLLSRLGITFPIFMDSDEELSKAFEVAAIPFSAILDRDGRVAVSETGERDWASDAVVKEVKDLLKKGQK